MGYRLKKIYTRTGDDGSTGLGDGTRIDKDHMRVETMGTIDELNCAIGLVLAEDIQAAPHEYLTGIQHRLFDLGAELSIPGQKAITASDIDVLEKLLDSLNGELPALKEFILPGGGRAAACCHLARAVCRRAERHLVTLARHEDVNKETLRYLNRLSDLLFVLARVLMRTTGQQEVMWEHH